MVSVYDNWASDEDKKYRESRRLAESFNEFRREWQIQDQSSVTAEVVHWQFALANYMANYIWLGIELEVMQTERGNIKFLLSSFILILILSRHNARSFYSKQKIF